MFNHNSSYYALTFSVFVLWFPPSDKLKNLSDPASTAHIEWSKKEPVEEMGTGRAYRYISVSPVTKPLSLFLLSKLLWVADPYKHKSLPQQIYFCHRKLNMFHYFSLSTRSPTSTYSNHTHQPESHRWNLKNISESVSQLLTRVDINQGLMKLDQALLVMSDPMH